MKSKVKIVFFILLIGFTSCYFPGYQSIAESNPYALDFSKGKWYLNNVFINGKSDHILDELAENKLNTCLNDSLYLSYGKRNAIYKVPLLNEKNYKENLALLKSTKTVDFVIQIVGNIGANEIGFVNSKPLKNEEKSSASVRIQVYDVQQGELIYSHLTSGKITVENNREDILFGKSAQAILKKCFTKELNLFLKHGGCK